MYRIVAIILLSITLSFPVFSRAMCESGDACIEVSRWDLGLAIGYGQKTNPLGNYDDIPIFVVPSIAYYGDAWFFDNGNVGYTLAEGENFTINAVTSYSRDRAFFYRWDPSNIFISGYSANVAKNDVQTFSRATLSTEPDFTPTEMETRNFTFLGGFETFLYTRFGILKLALTHDLFNVHQGSEAEVRWNYRWVVSQWSIDTGLVLNWKSEKVVDYYYGIRTSESAYWSQQYHASSAWNSGIEITARYAFTDKWDLLMVGRYTQIADEITASPLLDKDYTSTYFIGAAYRF